MPELGLELVRDVDRERIRSRLPRWDPRVWGDAAFLKNRRPGKRLLKLGLAWGRERVKARKLQQENVTVAGERASVSRFTGKEEDVEVGLQYFGKRFLSPYLGRWISADPLGVHEPGDADLNFYAYVRGHVLATVDPLGLQEIPPPPHSCANAAAGCKPPAPEPSSRTATIIKWVGAGAAVAVLVAASLNPRTRHTAQQAANRAGPIIAPIERRAAELSRAAAPSLQRAADGLARLGTRLAQAAMDKKIPVGGHVDVGGTTNKLASNLNPVLKDTGGVTKVQAIPNLVRAWGHQIAEFFEAGSAQQVSSAKLPYHTVKWEELAKGAYQVLGEKGTVFMNTWVQGNAAGQEQARSRLVEAFRAAGFQNVNVTGSGAGVIVNAIKPAAEAASK